MPTPTMQRLGAPGTHAGDLPTVAVTAIGHVALDHPARRTWDTPSLRSCAERYHVRARGWRPPNLADQRERPQREDLERERGGERRPEAEDHPACRATRDVQRRDQPLAERSRRRSRRSRRRRTARASARTRATKAPGSEATTTSEEQREVVEDAQLLPREQHRADGGLAGAPRGRGGGRGIRDAARRFTRAPSSAPTSARGRRWGSSSP